MGLLADATAYVIQRSAPRRVNYGDALSFAGRDLPSPEPVAVPTRHGDVRVDVYRPSDPTRSPIYVHFHGGAFIMRYPMMDDFFCRFVAAECGAVVVNVDYDVAPQVRFPVAQHQAHDAAAWAAEHATELTGRRGPVAVGGFSAGGNLAASACLQARDHGTFSPVLQILGVPSLDVAEEVEAKTSVRGTGMISPGLLRLVRRTYFPDPASRTDPYASPLLAADLAGLPPALVITGEYDVLRAEGDRYAGRLAEAGQKVTLEVIPGVDHYFLDGGRSSARATLDLVANTLTRAFAASG
ncbi:MAG: alpha/beta hydrolase [Nocardioidaceae bacterium]